MPIYDDTREDWGAAKGGHRTKVPHSHRTGFSHIGPADAPD